MQSNTIKALITVIVLSFGFISCSKDKENTVVYKQDEFKPDRISTENEDKNVIKDGDVTTLEAGGKLKFDALNKHDFAKDPVIFHIDSSCRQNSHPNVMTSRMDFQNLSQIEVIKLLPADVFATIDEDSAICDFTITTSNAVGSTNTNKLFNIEITNLLKFSNFVPEIIENDRVELELDRDTAIIVEDKGAATLVCQDFSRQQNLINGQFNLKNFLLEDSSVLSTLKTSTQNCRLVFDGSGSPQVSKFFSLNFPTQALSVAGIVNTLPIVNQIRGQKVLTIEVTNPNAFPVQFKMVRAFATRFVTRPLYMQSKTPLIGRLQRSLVDFKTTASEVNRINDDLVMTVDGKQTVTVDVIATRNLVCESNAPTVPRTPWFKVHANNDIDNVTLFAGYNYDYEINSSFLYDSGDGNWDELEMSFTGTANTENENNRPVKKKMNFMSISSYLRVN